MNGPHAPRPTDLVALVSFDGEVYENQAVTREGLGKPPAAPHALTATIQRWLGRGRQVWIDVRGRQIHGIATARPLFDFGQTLRYIALSCAAGCSRGQGTGARE